MTFRQTLMYSVPMRSILIATREHIRGYDYFQLAFAKAHGNA